MRCEESNIEYADLPGLVSGSGMELEPKLDFHVDSDVGRVPHVMIARCCNESQSVALLVQDGRFLS